jgi:hypothetical protein
VETVPPERFSRNARVDSRDIPWYVPLLMGLLRMPGLQDFLEGFSWQSSLARREVRVSVSRPAARLRLPTLVVKG